MTIALTLTAAARQALTASDGLQPLTITSMAVGSGTGTPPTSALRTSLATATVSGVVQSANDVVTVVATFSGVGGQVREIALFASKSDGSTLMLASQARASTSDPPFFSLSSSTSTVVTSVIAIEGSQSSLSVAASPKIEVTGPSRFTALSDTPSTYGSSGQLLGSSGSGMQWTTLSGLPKSTYHSIGGSTRDYTYRHNYTVPAGVTKLRIECAGPGGGPVSDTNGGTTKVSRGSTTLVSAQGGIYYANRSTPGNGIVGTYKWYGRGGSGSPHVSGGFTGASGGLAASTVTAIPGESLNITLGSVSSYLNRTGTDASPGWIIIEGFAS